MGVITAIALLCQVGAHTSIDRAQKVQRKCQVYYIDCYLKKHEASKYKNSGEKNLMQCVKEKK